MDFSTDYFSLFNLPKSFDLDDKVQREQLREHYRELQKSVHPDRFVNGSGQEKRLSLQRTSYLNEAYNTLKDPLKRGLYLLSLLGRDVDLETNTVMSPEFLMTQMELREELDEIPGSTDPECALEHFSQHVAKELAQIKQQVSAVLSEAGGAQDPAVETLDHAETLLREMTFLVKLQHQAEAMEERLFDNE